jgi:hypothetical protein
MAKAFGPMPPRRPNYMVAIADGVVVDSGMPDFGFDLPMPLIGRFAPKPEAP